MNAALLLSLSVFLVVTLLLAAIFAYYDARIRRKDIFNRIKTSEEKLILDKINEELSHRGERQGSFFSFIRLLGHKIKPKEEENISGLRLKLVQAGYRRENDLLFFFGYKAFCAALLASVFFLLRLFFVQAIQPGVFLAMAVLLGLLGFYLPNVWLRMKTNVRQETILEGFPDALDLMVVCVEAGLGLDAAINRVGEEMRLRNKMVSEEFRLLGLELRAGKLRREALRNLGIRTGLDEVKSLMTLLVQTDKFGTSIAQALRVHSDSMRTKRYQRAEEMAAKLPVKLVLPLILFIFPALFVVIIGPAAIKIYRVLLPAMG